MKLRAKLKQITRNQAKRKAAQLQARTAKVAHQLYLQRIENNRSGDETSDWCKAKKIVASPVRRSLHKARRTMPIRWWLSSGLSNKTAWEWLELLIVPLFLAAGAFYLETRVESRQERIATERYEQEARIAEERAKQDVLDNYLEKMQGLLLDRGLRESSEDSEVRSVARAITTTAIKELGSERNALLVDFLQESDLINNENGDEEEKASIALLRKLNLIHANLRHANLRHADLGNVVLLRADLGGANLRHADLGNAYLLSADLRYADLRGANLRNANLRDVYLRDADLRDADFGNVDLRGAYLGGANLEGTNVAATRFGEGIGLSQEEKQGLAARGAIFDDGQ